MYDVKRIAKLYALPKDRYLELKHHCAQWGTWFAEWGSLRNECVVGTEDPTGEKAARRVWLCQTCETIDATLHEVFDSAGTVEYLRGRSVILGGLRPEGKCDVMLYRKFFWLLDKKL